MYDCGGPFFDLMPIGGTAVLKCFSGDILDAVYRLIDGDVLRHEGSNRSLLVGASAKIRPDVLLARGRLTRNVRWCDLIGLIGSNGRSGQLVKLPLSACTDRRVN